jgi:nucleoside-diphosphate-sugar epimerase
MKILVIGGTRFLGYHIVRKLLDDGQEVVLFNRGLSSHDFGQRVKLIRGDRYDYQDFFKKMHGKKFDVVVDVIAYRAEHSRAAIKAFQSSIGHFFHISTAAVYVVTRDYPSPLKEEDFDRELYPRPKKNSGWWEYGYHKRKCEEVLRQAHQKQDFPVTMLRLPIVMGERDHTLRAYSYFVRLQDSRPLILPDGGMNVFTHVYQGDIAKTIASNLLNRTSFGQSYNLAQEEIVTLKDFVVKAAEIMKKKVEIVDIPSKVLENTPIGTSFSPFSMRRPFILQTQKAKKELNFSSTPFDVWLRKTVNWFAQGYRGDPPENYRLREKEIEIIQKFKKAMKSIH